jgi:hypothetical protein
LILKDAILVILGLATAEMALGKRKAGASSRTPNEVFYKVNCTRNRGKVKKILYAVWVRWSFGKRLGSEAWGALALLRGDYQG